MDIILAQLNPVVGDISGNCAAISALYQRHADTGDLVVCGELAITGYYPQDLLGRRDFIAAQDQALAGLAALTAGHRAALVLGFVDHNHGHGKPYHNALAILQDGAVVYRYHKHLLPTYDIFDEARHFQPGNALGFWRARDGNRIGLLICEDGWNDGAQRGYADNPVAAVMALDPDLVVSINASPSNMGKQAQRLGVFHDICAGYGVPLVYVNQVGGNDSIVFDGGSFAMNRRGEVIAALPLFAEAEGHVQLLERDVVGPVVTPDTPAAIELAQRQIVCGLADYVRKCGFRGVVVGSSGGIDSAVTLALAVEALGAERVHAITMPSRYSSPGSVDDSLALCRNLGVQLDTAPIVATVQALEQTFADSFAQPATGIARENLQARIRGLLLMAYSNQFGHLLLSTGNKSEVSVGYATLYGDMNGGLNLIGDLYKMEVYALAEAINQRHGREVIPAAIITKAPSAELAEGQRDSDSLPPYPLLDALLKLLIEPDVLDAAETAACRATVREYGGDVALVQRILQMIDRAEFKRQQAPPIVRVHRRAFGAGRQWPIAQGYHVDAAAIWAAWQT